LMVDFKYIAIVDFPYTNPVHLVECFF